MVDTWKLCCFFVTVLSFLIRVYRFRSLSIFCFLHEIYAMFKNRVNRIEIPVFGNDFSVYFGLIRVGHHDYPM